MERLGKKIRLLRQEKGWSQGDVAGKLDISVPAFSKIETGVTDINLSRLEQLAVVFELTVIDLITFDNTEVAKKNELADFENQLRYREEEVVLLQKKVIELYEEIRRVKALKANTISI